jgi:hypothetical protein
MIAHDGALLRFFPSALIRNYVKAAWPVFRNDAHQKNAQVVNSATAGLRFATLAELWLLIETVSH